jgi:hypothetical protein
MTPRRIKLAFAVGILADLLQLPVSLSLFAGFVPAEGLDAAIDVIAAVVINWLLGFHWALLPSFALKLIPVVDIAPTWTAGVAYVAFRRRHTVKADTGEIDMARRVGMQAAASETTSNKAPIAKIVTGSPGPTP